MCPLRVVHREGRGLLVGDYAHGRTRPSVSRCRMITDAVMSTGARGTARAWPGTWLWGSCGVSCREAVCEFAGKRAGLFQVVWLEVGGGDFHAEVFLAVFAFAEV